MVPTLVHQCLLRQLGCVSVRIRFCPQIFLPQDCHLRRPGLLGNTSSDLYGNCRATDATGDCHTK